ncbi:MAG: sulfurtransferase [Candidatus Hydrogenedentes bacterium]|nr:sulfurtransferase [Candidatus Hydrogenedentota bacterium]
MKHHNPRFESLVDEARARVRECTVEDVWARISEGETFHLIDVREESEFANGHLPRAKHLGKGIIERDVETEYPDTATELVLYCGGGYRSVLAADNLRRMGYTNVISMDGGYRGWTEAGHPTES